jgi:hypothetical protein
MKKMKQDKCLIKSTVERLGLIVLLILMGCGKESLSPTTSVSIVVKSPGGVASAQKASMSPAFSFVASFTVTVTGDGMDPLIMGFPRLSGGERSALFKLAVPNGNNRLFLVEGKNQDGKTIFKGSTTQNLNGTPVSVPVTITSFEFTKVFFPSVTQTISVGDTFTRDIAVFDVREAFYAAFDLTYDPAVIEYVGAAEGDVFKKDNGPTVLQAALKEGQSGAIVIGLTRVGQIGNISGSGKLMTLSFRAIAAGASTLTFSDPKGFRAQSHQDVPIDDWQNGAVTVEAKAEGIVSTTNTTANTTTVAVVKGSGL